jgi:cation:H+ antiporter
MLLSVLMLLAGVVLLVLAGDYLVKGAVGLAENMGISPLIIGLTVVAFGTSAPELFVSVQAALTGSPGIAVGNVVGSNIANVLLVLGLPAFIAPIDPRQPGLRRNLTAMLIATVAAMLLIANGLVGRMEGLVLFLGLCGYVGWQVYEARTGVVAPAGDIHDEIGEAPRDARRIAGYLIAGLIGLPIAAQLTVSGAVSIAERFGISDAVIGLTVVAVGTSLPELATTLVAAWRRSAAVALGNVVGSNIFNIAGILGLAAMITPLQVDPRIVSIDMWVMLAAAALVAVLGYARIVAGMGWGIVLVAGFIAYMATFFF